MVEDICESLVEVGDYFVFKLDCYFIGYWLCVCCKFGFDFFESVVIVYVFVFIFVYIFFGVFFYCIYCGG